MKKVKFIQRIGTYRLGEVIETSETHANFVIARGWAVPFFGEASKQIEPVIAKKKYKKGES